MKDRLLHKVRILGADIERTPTALVVTDGLRDVLTSRNEHRRDMSDPQIAFAAPLRIAICGSVRSAPFDCGRAFSVKNPMWHADRRQILRLLAAAPVTGLMSAARAADHDRLVVPTMTGLVRGSAAAGIRVFTGIPFGQAKRFGRPHPVARWQGIFDATGPARLAPQPPDIAPYPTEASEDCLQLNIWTPAEPGRYPVMVYIHGGGNETGWSGDAVTAGDRFAAQDIVCVTVNYRLGALGFLEAGALLGPAFAGSGNNGMRDLLLALHWIRANIAAFGGDPAKVTIAGESAGGKNVATLMGMPAADGLYRSAAMFSGGAETVHGPAEARTFASLFARALGGADRMLSASTDALIAAQQQAKSAWPRNFPFRPIVDGQLLPASPLDRIRHGQTPPVPLLIGSNADESRLFLTAAQAAQPLTARSVANETMARMAVLDRRYATAFPDLTPAERRWRLLTAEEYGMPGLRIAEAHAARGAPVYRYRFTYPTPGGPFKGHTPHALDVPFTFDHLDNPLFAGFFGLGPPDQPMADRMNATVVAFVADGRPAAKTLPPWPRFDVTARRTMVLDAQPRIVADPDRSERIVWQAA